MSEEAFSSPRVFTHEMRQDDPSKCTSAKMRRLGLARTIGLGRINRKALVLNPFSSIPVSKFDRKGALVGGIVVIDCSWVQAQRIFAKGRIDGNQRRLPALLAGNPTNYSKLASLSSLEAVAATLYIINFFGEARRYLSIYKWGETFLTLNKEPLEEYAKAENANEIEKIEREFFPSIAQSEASGR